MSAWQGARAGWAGYGSQSLFVGTSLSHSDYRVRLSEYARYEAYKQNVIYDNVRFFAEAVAANRKIYRGTQGLYNPIKRQNDLYASNVYSGSLNYDDLGEGALPLAYDNDALTLPLQQVLKWSNLGQQLSRYVGDAALYGDAFWWVVDDPLRQRVRLELLHPAKVRDMNTDEVGNIKAAVIEYERSEDADIQQYQPARIGSMPSKSRKSYVYTLKMTREDEDEVHFETFRDGTPTAFTQDADGTPLLDWYAPYPAVPMKHAMFEPTEEGWGANAFYASQSKLDQVNSVASQLNQSIRRVIEPILLAKNVNVATDSSGQKRLEFSSQRDESTGVSTLFVNGVDVDITPLTIPLDIGQATAHIQNLLLEIERDMPVLALQRIREQSSLTAPGVRSGYSDAIGRIESARMNLDTPLAQALQMAVTIGGVRGYSGFEAFSADSYDNGDMELRVKERAVFPDELTTQDRINAYVSVSNLPPAYQRVALADMNVAQDEIDAMVPEETEAVPGSTDETPKRMARVVEILKRAGVGAEDEAEAVEDEELENA